jgi:hypothetical protein
MTSTVKTKVKLDPADIDRHARMSGMPFYKWLAEKKDPPGRFSDAVIEYCGFDRKTMFFDGGELNTMRTVHVQFWWDKQHNCLNQRITRGQPARSAGNKKSGRKNSMNWIKKLFKRDSKKEPERKQRRLYTAGGGWGNSIVISQFKRGVSEQSVYGYKQRMPGVGDILQAAMISGRYGYWEFIEVKPCDDPRDMFFATVNAVGYADEEPAKTMLGQVTEFDSQKDSVPAYLAMTRDEYYAKKDANGSVFTGLS